MASAAWEISSLPPVTPSRLSPADATSLFAIPSPVNNVANRNEKSLRVSAVEIMNGSSLLKRSDDEFLRGPSGREFVSVAQDTLPVHPRVRPRLFIGIARVWSLPRAHEAMCRPLIGHRIVCLSSGFHLRDGIRNRGVYARVVPSVKAIHRSLDPRHRVFLRRASVENESRRQVRPIRREAKGLAAAPAKAADEELAA